MRGAALAGERVSPQGKRLMAERFARAADTYEREAEAQRRIAGRMLGLLLPFVPVPCPEIVEVGCGTGLYSRLLLRALRPERLWLNDLCPEMAARCADLVALPGVGFLPGDAERMALPGRPSLVTSCSALQWFERPEAFFRKCLGTLRPGGTLAFSTFGPDNLREVRQASGRGLPYRPMNELTATLPSGFRLLHAEEEALTLRFPHPLQVLYHLKRTGVTGLSGAAAWTRGDTLRFCERYVRTADGSVTLTYHPIYIIARKETT